MSHSVPEMPRDTSSGYAAVYARHKKDCATLRKSKCPCKPSYYGKVWDRSAGKHVKTRMLTSPSAAAQARRDLADMLAKGELPLSTGLRVRAAVERFVRAAEDGRALNKHGRRYKPSAVSDLKGCLEGHVVPVFERRRLTDLRRGDVQRLVDELPVDMSGSRVRSIVNAIRSLYAWAEDRDLVQHNPAARVRLPAVDAVPRDRVAAPVEAFTLLDALPYTRTYARRSTPGEKLPYALGVHDRGSSCRDPPCPRRRPRPRSCGSLSRRRRERSQVARSAAHRAARASARSDAQTLPAGARQPGRRRTLCPGDRVRGRNSGMFSFEALQDRADVAWEEAGMTRITAARMPSQLRLVARPRWRPAGGQGAILGHAAEGGITQTRYTHVPTDDIHEAARLLARFIAPRRLRRVV